ncbi:MAG: glycosyltransferase family 39 protein, partial [Anaerolineae bacterium]
MARVYRLGAPVLRWDEGWSLAHASLSWLEVITIGSQEWHSPLYIALLKLWLALGSNAWVIRLFSVVVGTLTVPVAYQVAVKWSGRMRVGLLMAAFTSFAPLFVYYSQVTRMYALSALAVLLASWFMLQDEVQPSWRSFFGLVFTSIVALYSFYLTAWALLGLWLYAVIAHPKRIGRLSVAGLLLSIAYLLWLWFTRGTLTQRFTGISFFSIDALTQTIGYLRPVLDGLVFVYGARSFAAAAVWIILVAGIAVGIWQRAALKPLLLPLCVLLLGIVGAAYSARVYWFAVRHLMPIVAFLGLALAWALDRLSRFWWPLLLAACLVLGLAYWPVSTNFVYEKTLEVTDAFDPSADYRYLEPRVGADDLIY